MKNNRRKGLIFGIVVIIIIVLLIVYGFTYNNNDNFNNLKLDKSQYLVYTSEEKDSGHYQQFIPFVNLSGELGELVNENIKEYINSFTNNDTCITYEYSLSGNLLSLIIKVEDHSYVESATILYFRSYNINLKQRDVISKETLFSYYNISDNEVLNNYNLKVKEYYDNLVNKNLINSNECNFNCFYTNREFKNNLDDAEYFVKDGKLFVYMPYTFISLGTNEEITYGFQVAE